MRNANEIYKEVFRSTFIDDKLASRDKSVIRSSVEVCIRKAQVEVINECSKIASKYVISNVGTAAHIEEEILSLINELK